MRRGALIVRARFGADDGRLLFKRINTSNKVVKKGTHEES